MRIAYLCKRQYMSHDVIADRCGFTSSRFNWLSMTSEGKPRSCRIMLAILRNPCPHISPFPYPSRPRAALIVFSDRGRSSAVQETRH